MRESETQYDMAKRGTATSIAVLRSAVAAYLAYLGYTLIRDVRAGGSAMSPVLAWTAGLLFIAAAVAFGFYTWRRGRADVEAARFSARPEDPEE